MMKMKIDATTIMMMVVVRLNMMNDKYIIDMNKNENKNNDVIVLVMR